MKILRGYIQTRTGISGWDSKAFNIARALTLFSYIA